MKRTAYWITTGLVAFFEIPGGAMMAADRKENIDGFLKLGYPVYFLMMLGVAKVLGGIAICAPGTPRLKEWAYAGIAFQFIAATVSHVAIGDAAWHAVVTVGILGLAFASWALRPPDRVLGRIAAR